ncbi:MAG TPA: hypothetical protein PLH98_18820 [Ruminococcus flavefaciens]|nr:hypothetical protein [Ruminococcus flavefaciens]
MKWITLIGDATLTLNRIKDMKHTGAIRAYDVESDRYCVEYNNGHIFYDFDNDLSDWHDDLKNLPFKANCCIMMVYTNAQNVRTELLQPDFPQVIYVDNDHGTILPLKEYIAVGMPMDE